MRPVISSFGGEKSKFPVQTRSCSCGSLTMPRARMASRRLQTGFDEGEELGPGFYERQGFRQGEFQGNETDVADDEIDFALEVTGGEIAGVEAFDGCDIWICMKRSVKLAVAHVDGCHMGRPLLQQHLGEASRRGANIKAIQSLDGDTEETESAFELERRARDIAPRFIENFDAAFELVF